MNRWVANKLGLLNFWYYDEEEFELANGKLLFRGSNGSGKSVTMQSFIPLLLDGNKSPERLDPFGSRARRIENYLLDEEINERTAYLYIEFKRQNQEHYLTIGMGLKAVRNKPLDSWYFIITDGRRIGKDLQLYRAAGEKIPLTKKQLENELKEGGLFTSSQGEYMKMVNDQLFGFESVENYEELLNLLINLRSPKLSKDFKPTEIYKILSSSLKVLSEDDLRPMSEAMENMDSYQGNLESYERTQRACKNIKYYYDAYNHYQLFQKATDVLSEYDQLSKYIKKQKDHQTKLEQMKAQHQEQHMQREEKEALKEQAELQYEQLSNRKEVGIKKEIVALEESIAKETQFIEAKEKQLEDKKDQRIEKEKQKKLQQAYYESEESQMKDKLEVLEEAAQKCFFEEGALLTQEIMEDPLTYSFDYIEITIDKYLKQLQDLQKEIIAYEEVKEKEEKALQEKEEKEKAYLEMKSQAQEAHRLLLQAKEDYKVQFVNWQQQAKHMQVMDEGRIELFKQVDGLEKDSQLLEINQYLMPIYEKVYRAYGIDLERKQAEIASQKAQIEVVHQEIEALKNAKEVEPERNEAILNNRARLEREGIAFSPLYKVVDFKPETDEVTRRNIESALVSMGLIDALVVNAQDLEKALTFNEHQADQYILAEAYQSGQNLSRYLEVDQANLSGIQCETVERLLEGIHLTEDKLAYVNEKGEYGLGILRGKADEAYQTKYIGTSARRKHREFLIKQKEEELAKIEEVVSALIGQLEKINRQLEELQNEYTKLPTLEDLRAMLVLRMEKERETERLNQEFLNSDTIYFEWQQKCQQFKVALYDKMQGIKVPATRARFEEAIESARNYKFGLVELKAMQSKLKNYKQMLMGLEEDLERLEEELDQFMYEIGHQRQELKQQKEKKAALEEVLRATDIKEIEAQLNWCLQIKMQVPEQLQQIDTTLGELTIRIDVIQEELAALLVKMQQSEERLQVYLAAFKEEYALGYVHFSIGSNELEKERLFIQQEATKGQNQEAFKVDGANESTEEAEKTEGITRIEKVEDAQGITLCKKIVDSLNIDSNKAKESYTVALMEALNRNGADLREYGVKANQENGRVNIVARMDGKEIDFYQFATIIDKYIEETRLLISEEERRVFEEVLLNTISSKITSKIYLSKQWIDKINRLMESMKTSSSLRLSLKWVPRKAEQEGQLDISELLKLLELGDRCSDEDMKKITDHFGAKVKEGIRNYEGTGDAKNYHTIIQEVLDYRKWYEFKLFFEKKNERKKELTNNDFFRFSGGEKAMSMYIPLFSAVYARYENARKDCPRVISMDEAFAGVDEANIRDMFRLLDELDLDFIINSQVLWGDYDTVKELAISEIIREENDTTVVVLRYLWNGIQKVLL